MCGGGGGRRICFAVGGGRYHIAVLAEGYAADGEVKLAVA